MPACEALVAGGINAMEVTLTTPDALNVLRQMQKRFGDVATTGIGSVLNAEMCRAAIEAGAEFIVTPITKKEIVDVAHAANRPVMMGAYTPTEAQLAHEAGADFIKMFPANDLGPNYIRAIRAPLPHLKIVPTGGVDANTARDFLKAGCAALGVGTSLVSQKILREGDWKTLTQKAAELVKIAREFRA